MKVAATNRAAHRFGDVVEANHVLSPPVDLDCRSSDNSDTLHFELRYTLPVRNGYPAHREPLSASFYGSSPINRFAIAVAPLASVCVTGAFSGLTGRYARATGRRNVGGSHCVWILYTLAR